MRVEFGLILFFLFFFAIFGRFLESDRFLLVFDLIAELGVGLDHLDREVEDGLFGITACFTFFFSGVTLSFFLVLFTQALGFVERYGFVL